MMSKVYELDLHGKNIRCIEGFEKCKALRVLDLSCNQIEHTTGLNSNQQLRELKLYGNQIECIEGLEKLQELCNLLLQHNKIKCVGRGLAGLRKLQVLRLDHNRLVRLTAGELAPCCSLCQLELSYNQLESVTGLAALANLEELKMAANRLTTVPSDLSRCKKLQELDLSNNPIDVVSLSQLESSRALKILRLNGLAISAVGVLPKLAHLEELYMACNELRTLQGLKEWFPLLEVVDVRSNQLSSLTNGISPLRGLASLIELLLEGNEMCSSVENYRDDVKSLLPQLETIDSVCVSSSASSSTGAVGVAPPLMRPLTPSSVGPSLQQVEQQLVHAELQLDSYSSSLTAHFQLLQASIERDHAATSDPPPLPLVKPTAATAAAAAGSGGGVTSTDSTTERPSTRSGSRGRLQEALAFASEHFVTTHSTTDS